MEGFDCISVLAMRVIRISVYAIQVINLALFFKLARFATKCYSSQVENHLILLIDVRYILFEGYNLIRAEMWEEFAAQIINLGHFCLFIM